MKTITALLLSTSLFIAGCADLASDCERLGTCIPADFEGTLPSAPLGAACAADAACGSGFCVDGICCDTACDAACGTCTVPGAEGHCVAEAGRTCGGGVCDGGGFCARGEATFVQAIGTDADDDVAPGALLPGVGVLVGGTASPSLLTVGDLQSPPASARGFSGVVAADGTTARLQVWGSGTIDATTARPSGGALLGGRFETSFAVDGLGSLDNTDAADGFVVGVDAMGTAQWMHHLISTSEAPTHIEALAGSDTDTAIAVWKDVDGRRQRVVQMLDAGGLVRGEVHVALGENLEQDGSVTGLAFDASGRLWMLADYRGEGSLTMNGSTLALPRSSPLPGAALSRAILVAFDVDDLAVVAGPYALGTGDVRAGGLAVRADTIYLGGGLSDGVLDVEPAPGAEPGQLVSDALGHDPFILALDEAGRRRWSAAWPSDAAGTTPRSLAVSPAGDVAFVGSLEAGTLDLGGQRIGAAFGEASFVGKLSPEGALLWHRAVEDAAGTCRLDWVGIAADGRVWTTGSATGVVLGTSGLGGRDLVVATFEP